MTTKTSSESISIVQMKSRSFEGWKIFDDHSSCGSIKFKPITEGEFAGYANVEIYINQPKRGLHIGRIALQKSIASSKFDSFFARLRKNNIACFKALSASGFTVHSTKRQYTMLYER